MYEAGTILVLREPRSTETETFAWDRVKVVGTSPVNHANSSSEWVGATGQGVIIEPLTEFGAHLDEPFGKLQMLYDVESIPEPVEVPLQPMVRHVRQDQLGPSPEDVFRKEAPGRASTKAKAKSPLDGAAAEAIAKRPKPKDKL